MWKKGYLSFTVVAPAHSNRISTIIYKILGAQMVGSYRDCEEGVTIHCLGESVSPIGNIFSPALGTSVFVLDTGEIIQQKQLLEQLHLEQHRPEQEESPRQK